MKKLKILLFCAALLCTLVGCAQELPPVQEPPFEAPTDQEIVVPTPEQPPVQEEEELPQEEDPAEEPTRPQYLIYAPEELQFEKDSFLQSGPEETLLIYSRSMAELTVTVYDTEHNTVLASENLGDDAYVLSQIFADKTFCVASLDGERYQFYNKELELVHAYRRPVEEPGYFSHDKRYYYYASEGVLHRYVMASGKDEALEVAGGMPVRAIQQIHPELDVLSLIVETDPFGLNTANAVYDAKSGELGWLQADYASMTFSKDGTMYYLYEDEGYRCIYDDGAAAFETTLAMNDLQSFQPVSGGAYLLAKMAEGEQSVRLYRFSDQTGYADLSLFEALHDPISMEYDAATGLLAFTVRLSEEEPCRVALLDLSRLEFFEEETAEYARESLIDSEQIERFFAIQEPVQLRGGLEVLRGYADLLERQFGVCILFSRACEEPCADSDFVVATTDTLSLRYETQLVFNALTQMQKTLESYPEGFFRQFQSETISGVRFLLTSTIESSYGVVAYEYFRDGWFNIVYDVNYQSGLTANLNHEIWHATEEKLNFIDGVWFDEERWAGYNPEGFVYSEDYESHYDNSSEYVYYTEHEPERIYFIDTYSKTFAKEDRARIMEYAMSYPYFMERLQYSEAIMEKLSYMAEVLRENFDSEHWQDTVLWEAYLVTIEQTP